MPRFAYVVEEDLSIDNGPGINEREFIEVLTRNYHDEVVCVAPRPRFPENHFNERISYVIPHHGSLLRYPAHVVATYRRLKKLKKRRDVDAFVLRLGASPLLAYGVSRIIQAPLILKKLGLYSIFGQRILRSKLKNSISKSFFPLYREVIRSCIGADVESESYPEWLHERFGIGYDQLVVIPNGANTHVFKPGESSELRRKMGLETVDCVVGYVGALSRLRNVDLLIRSVVEIENRQNVALVLVGDGEDRYYLEDIARQLGVDDRVIFVGKVPYSRVREYIQCFDVGVDLTAIEMNVSDGVNLASYSQKIPQYLACGVPVVAWECPDTEFLALRRIGRTVPHGDEQALRSAISELSRASESERKSTRSRARTVAEEEFSVEVLAERRVKWWKSLLREGPMGDDQSDRKEVGEAAT